MRTLWAWGPAVAWMGVIFYFSHQPVVDIPMGAPDYVAHAIGYAALGGLLMWALAGARMGEMSLRLAPWAIVIGALYGVSDEFHQSFIPGRFPSVSDVVADTVGAIAGAFAAVVVSRWWRSRAGH